MKFGSTGSVVSEEKTFEEYGRRTTDGRRSLSILYTLSSPMSLNAQVS